jgi:2-amino-4-hydroxy-6-hydroxymethyldihydropteridine diphosphokinase
MSLLTSAATKSFVALGSNLGDSVALLRCAMDRVQEFSTQSLLKSSLWQSTPVDCPRGSPMFVNAVVALTPREGETPGTLLDKLHALELEFGRRPRQVLNEPRPLDLDLIAFGDEVRDTPRLTLPHPRAHLRRFVLEPLNEIAPDLVLPRQTRTVGHLLAGLCTGEVVTRLSRP